MTSPTLSVIIPARNEEALIADTLKAVLHAQSFLREIESEIWVVDNGSQDRTADIVSSISGVNLCSCPKPGAGAARNAGAGNANGDILVFLDADTLIPACGLSRIADLCRDYDCGMFDLRGAERSVNSRVWWLYFSHVRRLPLSMVKAMSAFMFCRRKLFVELGGFDESVSLGEEWAVLAQAYRKNRKRFIYDRSIRAITSGRRMEQQRWGYLRTYIIYFRAVFLPKTRKFYPDHYR
jgi:glycosyltransferase involved in cell wall biosynthesis